MTEEGRSFRSVPLQRIAHRGACGKTPVVPHTRSIKALTCENGMRECLHEQMT
jgi:hypothetical protein